MELLLCIAIAAVASASSAMSQDTRVVSPAARQVERPILVGVPTSVWGEPFDGEARGFRVDGTRDSSLALRGLFAAWSPDGQSIAHLERPVETGTLLHVRRNGGSDDTIRVASTGSGHTFASWLMWSPSGEAVGFILGSPQADLSWTHELVVLDVNPLRVKQRYPIPHRFNGMVPLAVPTHAAWSPNGKAVLLSGGDRAAIIDLETGVLDGIPENVAAAAWMPDGRSIGFLSSPPFVALAFTGFYVREIVNVLPASRTSVRLADSSAIAAAGIARFPDFYGWPARMERSPSGRRVAIGGGRGDSNAVFIYNTLPSGTFDVTKPDILINLGAQVPAQLEWSPDENQIAAWIIENPQTSTRYSVHTIDLRTQSIRLVTHVAFGGEVVTFGSMLKLLSWSR